MADKVMFTAVIDKNLARTIGIEDDSPDNLVRIIRTAAKELRNVAVGSGRITDILIEKKNGLWKIIIFKAKLPAP